MGSKTKYFLAILMSAIILLVFKFSWRKIASSGIKGVSMGEHETVQIVLERMNERKRTLKTSCSKLNVLQRNIYEEISQPRSYLSKTLFYSDKYKVIFCSIPKCASRNQGLFLAVLEGIDNEIQPGDIISAFMKNRLSMQQHLDVIEIEQRMEKYRKILFVREPFSRLISAFRDKLENAIDETIHYTNLSRMIHNRYGKKDEQETSQNRATLSNFIKYLTDPEKDNQRDPHWNYYNRLCDPCTIKYDFIVHVETLEEDLSLLAKELGITDFSFPASFDSFTDVILVTSNKIWSMHFIKDMKLILTCLGIGDHQYDSFTIHFAQDTVETLLELIGESCFLYVSLMDSAAEGRFMDGLCLTK